MVWTDSRQGTPSIFGTRVSRQGAVLDVAGIKISSGDVPQTASSIAWNGSSYLVAWGGTRAGARRVGANGNVLDAADIDLPGISMYDVASNGVDFLVVGTPTGGSNAIAGLRVSGAGTVLDATPIAISPAATGNRYTPRPAFDGTNYWVVWLDNRTGTSHPFGARVTPAGQVLDPSGIQLTEPTGTEYHGNPDVASDGAGTSFAVWEDSRSYAIRGTRLTAAGQVLDPAGAMVLPTPSAYDLLSVPVVAFDGTNYVLGAVDHKNNSSFSTISYNLMANRFTPAGASLGGLQVASQPTATVPGTVASESDGRQHLHVRASGHVVRFPGVARARANLHRGCAHQRLHVVGRLREWVLRRRRLLRYRVRRRRPRLRRLQRHRGRGGGRNVRAGRQRPRVQRQQRLHDGRHLHGGSLHGYRLAELHAGRRHRRAGGFRVGWRGRHLGDSGHGRTGRHVGCGRLVRRRRHVRDGGRRRTRRRRRSGNQRCSRNRRHDGNRRRNRNRRWSWNGRRFRWNQRRCGCSGWNWWRQRRKRRRWNRGHERRGRQRRRHEHGIVGLQLRRRKRGWSGGRADGFAGRRGAPPPSRQGVQALNSTVA